ncbi:MAG: cation transporter [Lachnospiraceae bacterium]|nr:cation transporter [Lachnospiraceae bacterium]
MERRKAYGTLCSIVGICLNIVLFAGKYMAGLLSGSVAITADAFNNLSDAGSSIITLIGFLFAGKEPDLEHPFGHGRFEYLSGFLVSIAIILMGFELMKSSVAKIIHPEQIDTSYVALGILAASILVKLYMALYNKKGAKIYNSPAMDATAVDSLSDSVATTVVMITMLIFRFTGINLDGYCGVIVAGLILYAGYQSVKDTVSPLLGVAPDEEFVDEIEKLVMEFPHVEGVHDLVVHDYGPGRMMISLHAEVPGNEDIYVLHDEIDRIERELKVKLQCEAVIHMDPIEVDNEELKRVKQQVKEKIKEWKEEITIHDFRMVPGVTHTNLIFDVVVTYDMGLKEQDVIEKVQGLIREINPLYIGVIQVDYAKVKQNT